MHASDESGCIEIHECEFCTLNGYILTYAVAVCSNRGWKYAISLLEDKSIPLDQVAGIESSVTAINYVEFIFLFISLMRSSFDIGPLKNRSLHYFQHHPHVYDHPLQTIFCSVSFPVPSLSLPSGSGLTMGTHKPRGFRSYPTGHG
jgi:hypothetical protein